MTNQERINARTREALKYLPMHISPGSVKRRAEQREREEYQKKLDAELRECLLPKYISTVYDPGVARALMEYRLRQTVLPMSTEPARLDPSPYDIFIAARPIWYDEEENKFLCRVSLAST